MANGGWHLESSASQEPHSVDDGRPPLAAEGQGGGDAFAGWAGDGEGCNALAAGSQPRDAWSVHHEDRAVHDLAHLRHDRGVAGVQDRGVPEFMLALPGQGDGPIDVRDPHERNEGHHLLFLDERMLEPGLAEQKIDARGQLNARMLGKEGGVFADEFLVNMRLAVVATLERGLGESFDLTGSEPKASPRPRSRVATTASRMFTRNSSAKTPPSLPSMRALSCPRASIFCSARPGSSIRSSRKSR